MRVSMSAERRVTAHAHAESWGSGLCEIGKGGGKAACLSCFAQPNRLLLCVVTVVDSHMVRLMLDYGANWK